MNAIKLNGMLKDTRDVEDTLSIKIGKLSEMMHEMYIALDAAYDELEEGEAKILVGTVLKKLL